MVAEGLSNKPLKTLQYNALPNHYPPYTPKNTPTGYLLPLWSIT